MAKRDVFSLLTSDKTWGQLRLGQDSSQLHFEMQPEDMFRAAKLCAVEGEVLAATATTCSTTPCSTACSC